MSKAMFPTAYSLEFEEARKIYRPPANDSKSDGYRAWQQVKLERPHQSVMLAVVRAYGEWLVEQNVERTKFRQGPYPKKLFATFMRSKPWENETLFDRAQQIINYEAEKVKMTESDKSKIEGWSKLRAEIGDPAFGAYFVHAIYDETKNAIVLPKPFLVSLVNERHLNAIHRSFNSETLVTCNT